MNNKRKSRYKSRGSILVITALAAVVWIFIAQSLFIVGAGGFGMIKSSRVALQAQQYAEIAVDRLKNIDYDNLDSEGAHSRQAIANIQESGWEDEVIIGTEHAINGSDDAKQRIATINVYKSGDTISRFTLEVPLSSQGSSAGGAIVDWARGQSLPDSTHVAWGSAPERSYTVPKDGVVTGTTTAVKFTNGFTGSSDYTGYFLVNNCSIPSVCYQSVTESLGDDRTYDKTTTTNRYMVYVKKGDVIRYKYCYGVAFYPLRH